MPEPPKTVKILEMEKKSHRTKAELRQRKAAEEALLTGVKIRENPEVKANEKAHREFLRIKKLLEKIDKNDDLYGNSINRYCLLSAECADFEEKREDIFRQQELLEEAKGSMKVSEYIKLQDSLSKNLLAYDRQIQQKRKMMFAIEKENVMTIASALRTIPKKAEKKKNALQEALSG